jgi:hypothetical protein
VVNQVLFNKVHPQCLTTGMPGWWWTNAFVTIIAAIVCCFVAISCEAKCPTEPPSKPTPLVPGLDSFMSPDQVRDRLRAGEGWKVSERSGLPKGDRRPPFNILAIDVSAHTNLGIPGRLRLNFFNNRLQSTQFFPSDLNKYRMILSNKTGLSISGIGSLPPQNKSRRRQI